MTAIATRLGFSDLPGWAEDCHDAAFAVLHRACRHIVARGAELRAGLAPGAAQRAVSARIARLPAILPPAEARAAFERWFEPVEVAGSGFMTGYYEPEFAGSLTRTTTFRVPLYGRPPDLVALSAEDATGGLAGLAAARRRPDGGLEPYPDRAAIEDGALADRGLELLWLADPFDAFIAQVQGSLRVRLADGTVERLAYAGRNGHPYRSVGGFVVERGRLAREEVTLPRLRALFAAEPELARTAMRANPSFVFFARLDGHDSTLGPIGAQGLPLTPGRSIAVDRTIHAYGLPFFVIGALPGDNGDAVPLRRLMIAQDTGSAIAGPARIDYFAGWGAEAERVAGLLKAEIRLVRLEPKPGGG